MTHLLIMTTVRTIMHSERDDIFEPHPNKILKKLEDKPEKKDINYACISRMPVFYEKDENPPAPEPFLWGEIEGPYDHEEDCDETISNPTESSDEDTISSDKKRKRESFIDTDDEIEYLIKRQRQEEICPNIFEKMWEAILNFFHNIFFL